MGIFAIVAVFMSQILGAGLRASSAASAARSRSRRDSASSRSRAASPTTRSGSRSTDATLEPTPPSRPQNFGTPSVAKQAFRRERHLGAAAVRRQPIRGPFNPHVATRSRGLHGPDALRLRHRHRRRRRRRLRPQARDGARLVEQRREPRPEERDPRPDRRQREPACSPRARARAPHASDRRRFRHRRKR